MKKSIGAGLLACFLAISGVVISFASEEIFILESELTVQVTTDEVMTASDVVEESNETGKTPYTEDVSLTEDASSIENASLTEDAFLTEDINFAQEANENLITIEDEFSEGDDVNLLQDESSFNDENSTNIVDDDVEETISEEISPDDEEEEGFIEDADFWDELIQDDFSEDNVFFEKPDEEVYEVTSEKEGPLSGWNSSSWGKTIRSKDTFMFTDSRGVKWYCVRFQEEATKCAVFECYNNNTPELTIPNQVTDEGGQPFTVAGIVGYFEAYGEFANNNGCFFYNSSSDQSGLCKVTIPDTVEYIGTGAFWNYYNLEEVILPNNANLKIGSAAFDSCINLKKIYTRGSANGTILAPVINNYVFQNCTKLESLTFSPDAEVMRTCVAGCTGLKSITNAPSTLEMGGDPETPQIYALETIVYAEGPNTIGGLSSYYNAQVSFPNLTTIILPSSAKSIDYNAFSNLRNLASINLENITEIGDGAFYGCKNLHISVKYPGTSYREQFAYSGITDITFNADIHEIQGKGFKGCSSLKSINVAAGSDGFSSQDGVLYTYVYNRITGEKIGKSLMKYPAAKNVGGTFTLPSDCPSFFGYTFDGCNLSQVTVPVTTYIYDADYKYDNEKDDWIYIYPFDNMVAPCTICIVKHSSIDGELTDHGVPANCTIKYITGPTVKITYNLDGGTNNKANPTTFVAGTTITLQDPTKKGYVFDGWDFTGNTYTPSGSELYKGVTFTANWIKMEKSIAKAEVTGLTDKTYTGKAIKPKLKVILNNTTLKSGTDYTIAYKNNKAIGKATITITGKGNYNGKLKKTFLILPKGTSVSKVTGAKKQLTIKWKKQAKETTGYQIQYSLDKNFKTGVKSKLIKKNTTVSLKVKKLKAKKTYYVRIRTYKKVGKTNYYSSWSKVKSGKTK